MSTTDDATMNMMQLKYVAGRRGRKTISIVLALGIHGDNNGFV